MARFDYSALSAAGDLVAGELDGPDAAAVIATIARTGAAADRCRRAPAGRAGAGGTCRGGGRARSAAPTWRCSAQQLARLLRAGLPLDRALDILATLAAAGRWPRDPRHCSSACATAPAWPRRWRRPTAAFPAVLRHHGPRRRGGRRAARRCSPAPPASSPIRGGAAEARLGADLSRRPDGGCRGLGRPGARPSCCRNSSRCSATPAPHLPASTRMVMLLGDGLRDHCRLLLSASALAALRAARRAPAPRASRRCATGWLLAVPLLRTAWSPSCEIGRFSRTLAVLLANGVPARRARCRSAAARSATG